MPVDSQMAKRFMCPDCDIPIRGDHGVTESGTGGAYCERCGRGWGETADESLDAPCDLAANRTDENFTCLQRAGHAGPCDMVITGKGMKAKAPRTPEYTAEQVAEVVEGLNAIITEPAECWQPTHISRDDIRTVLAEIKRLTLQVESAEADTKRLDDAQTLFIGADFAWGDPEHPRPVVVLQIPEHVRVGVDFRKFLDAARNREGGND